MPYRATIRKPFTPPYTVEGANLRELLKDVRRIVVTSSAGTSANIEHVESGEPYQVAAYENREGRLRKVV